MRGQNAFDLREHPRAELWYYNPRRPAPIEIANELCVVETLRYGFDRRDHLGHLVVHRELENDVRAIFAHLYRAEFPIARMMPISVFDWDDEVSMRMNNTSGFNYRYIAGSNPPKLSQHAYGRAIDINPWLNPQLKAGIPSPRGARYDPSRPGTIAENSIIVQLFRERGWDWGGEWPDPDYQHFEKSAKTSRT